MGRSRNCRQFLLIVALTLPLSACDPFGTQFDDTGTAEYVEANEVEPHTSAPDVLTVMTWNVKFGGGRIDFFFDCHGDRVLMKHDEVIDNLRAIAAKINQVNPDILILQEVDRNSKRAAFVDQLRWLLNGTHLNYGVYASQWRADFVPSDGLGAVDSGNAILSRWPLREAERIGLDLRSDQSGLVRYFYLRRNLLKARVAIPDHDAVWVVGVHTAAYSQDGTKRSHIDRFTQELLSLSKSGASVLGGGDLNTLPPDSDKVSNFPDSVCTDEEFQADDYSEETDWLDPLYESFEPAIDLARYAQDNSLYFSHTTDKDGFWNRKLDYLFTNTQFEEGSGLVHQDKASGGMETMSRSDHAPVTARWRLP